MGFFTGVKRCAKNKPSFFHFSPFFSTPLIRLVHSYINSTCSLFTYLIAHKFRMDAVHNQTSTASHTEHQTSPKIQISKISQVAENGSTAIPTIKSATARDTEKVHKFHLHFQNSFSFWNVQKPSKLYKIILDVQHRPTLKNGVKFCKLFFFCKSMCSLPFFHSFRAFW